MYFVTTKLDGYVLFAMTPSEQAGVGLTEKQEVHVLERAGDGWNTIAKWNAAEFSHTELMTAWHHKDEPTGAAGLLQVLPEPLRQRLAN